MGRSELSRRRVVYRRTSPRPVITGRSSAVTMPGAAATTAGTEFTRRMAVTIMPETL